MDEIRVKIKIFLSRFFRNIELRDDENIFATGVVNSLFAMQLVMFIEKEFNISINNQDLDIDNFGTINSIVDFVGRKQAAQK
jgi:acyl carrier protein